MSVSSSAFRSADRWSAFLDVARRGAHIAAIGSLIWKPIPGTRPVAPVRIEGYRKDFNTRVTRCRGTEAAPGLVLGLEPDRGAAAQGLLLEVDADRSDAVWDAFRDRELSTADYVPAMVAVRRLDTDDALSAAAVLVDTRSDAYVRLTAEVAAEMILRSHGTCGANLEYALRTLDADRLLHADGLPPHLAALDGYLRAAPR